MADDGNEESWLYGSGDIKSEENDGTNPDGAASACTDEKKPPSENATDKGDGEDLAEDVKPSSTLPASATEASDDAGKGQKMDTGEPEEVVPNPADEMEEADREDGERLSGEENSESEEDDDDINVVIGDIKAGPNYNIKQRGNLIAGASAAKGGADASAEKAPGGKFSMEEFESVGTINGTPAHEFSIDSLDEKPWRKPGADITDYFNYGFNEETWRMYCERQKRMRQNESGVGLQGLMVAPVMVQHNHPVDRSGPGGRTLTPIANDNSKYGALTSMPLNRRAGPPPARRMTGAIDVIGGPPGDGRGGGKHENAIQVMTAERREYSRPGGMPGNGGGKFDMPPPAFGGPGAPGGNGTGGPNDGRGMGPGGPIIDAFADEFSYGYEPTQDSQWGVANPDWAPPNMMNPMVPQMVPAPMGAGAMGPGPMVDMPPGMHGGGGPPPQQQQQQQQQQRYPSSSSSSADREARDRAMRGERSDRDREARDRDRDRGRSDRDGEKDRRSASERDSSRRRSDRSRSRERSRRRSRSREKSTTSSSSSSRHRERSTRDKDKDKKDDRDKKKEAE